MLETQTEQLPVLDSSTQLTSVIAACNQARVLAEQVLQQKLDANQAAYIQKLAEPCNELNRLEAKAKANCNAETDPIEAQIAELERNRQRFERERLEKLKPLQNTLDLLKQLKKDLKALPTNLAAAGLKVQPQQISEADIKTQIALVNKAIKKLEAAGTTRKIDALRKQKEAIKKKYEAELSEPKRAYRDLEVQTGKERQTANDLARHENWLTLEAIKTKEAEALAQFSGVGA